MRAFLVLSLLLVSWAPAHAGSLGAAEQVQLNQTRDAFIQAMRERDYEIIVSVVPPGIIEHVARTSGVTDEELRSVLPSILERAMQNASFTAAEMVTENLDASRADAGGESYAWGFAPSTFEFTIDGQKFRSEGFTLALLDGGSWYLVRTSERDKVEMMRRVYPFFATLEFPQDTLAVVE